MVNLRDNKKDADAGERLSSLDGARGVFLLLMVGGGFGLRQMLSADRWGWITSQWAHRDWQGCSVWDLLQPALLFLVGVAMPYSYANRQARGQNWVRQLVHALKRAALLIVIGMYLDSYRENHLVIDVRGDLQQIGIAYLLAFFLLPAGMPVQGVTVAFLLIGHTAAHVIYALASGNELWAQAHNVGIPADQWLHLPPHQEHYVTLNALPATAIVLLGMLVSGLVRGGLTPGAKVAIMTGCSLFGILFGWLLAGGNGWIELSWPAIIPMIKRLLTWTFVFTSVGWTLLIFTYFYLLMDGFHMQTWALPLAVFGRNALFLYVTFQLFHDWAARSAALVLPDAPPTVAQLQPLFVSLIILAIFWLICFWLYRRRIFFRV
jgi:predicted acyltransferase